MMKNFALSALLICALLGCNLPSSPVPAAPLARHPMSSEDSSSKLISFHEERVRNDPSGSIGWRLLAESYLAAASERDDDTLAVKAEKAARKSLELRRNRNEAAAIALTKSLLAQHRFSEAYEAIGDALKLDPENVMIRRQRMEIQLELGLYSEFRAGLNDLERLEDPASLALRARWAGLTGKPDLEVNILQDAVEQVDAVKTLSASVVASYRVLLGSALLRSGDLGAAKAEFDEAISLHPGSYHALAGRTRVAAAAGDAKEVIRWAAKTNEHAVMTDIEGLAALAFAKLGRGEEAKATVGAMIKANLQPGQTLEFSPKHSHGKTKTRHTHDRLFAMALADLGQHVGFAHHAAEEDLENRKDIYAYDAFAWATYRYWQLVPASVTGEGDGLLREAEKAMEKALGTGSRDPKLMYHAAEIFKKSNPNRSAKLLKEEHQFDLSLMN